MKRHAEKRKASKVDAAVAVAISFLAPAVALVIQYGGLTLNYESMSFFFNYLSSTRSAAATVFDPLSNDWGAYQAREWSYLIDYLDVELIALSIRNGLVHLYAPSYLFFMLTIGFVVNVVWRDAFRRLSDGTVLLGSILLLASPFLFWAYSFFRSSKPFCAMALAVLLGVGFRLYRNRTNPAYRAGRGIGVILIGMLLMGLADRQGVFFAALITVGIGLAALAASLQAKGEEVPGARVLCRLACGGVAVLAVLALYNRVLAPALIFALNGYRPDWTYQQIGIGAAFHFDVGAEFVFGGLGVLFGETGIAGGVLFALLIPAGLLVPFLIRRRAGVRQADARSALHFTAAYFYLLFGMIVCANLMGSRHPAILWPEVLRGSYFAPNAVIVVFFLLLSLQSTVKIWPAGRRKSAAFTALLLLTAANIRALPRSYDLLADGIARHEIAITPGVLAALRDRSIDYRTINLPFRAVNFIAIFRGDPIAAPPAARRRLEHAAAVKVIPLSRPE